MIHTCAFSVLLGLIHTCASQPAALALDNPGEISYKQYLPFWELLLSDKNISSSQQFPKLIYGEFIRCHVRMIGRLDLSLEDDGKATEEISDPTMKLIAKNPEDLKIFVNMVDCVT